ncbi:hypothetical protein J8631_01390 [Serratia fonticola]|uniref:hypothetical protein n=1 Tax=Serratia TaxID=613 RepID=UPI001AE6C98C|nr:MULTISPECIES: hypothetical protein [Serratia]MBP1034205.1 hypothetical protein [Serratia fonticola]UAN52189.1 hypothetical protein KGP26_03665 [Serratia sp. JSRIV002]UAN52888.1 hypothetical protein KGP26_07450 [Serratia sp. JSRIV002]
MDKIDAIIDGLAAERDKHLADLQYLVMTSAAWGIKKVDVDVIAASGMVKLSEKLLRSQIALQDAMTQRAVILSVLDPSVQGYRMPEKSETAEAISLQLKDKFISAFAPEQQKESPVLFPGMSVGCQEKAEP